MRTPQAAAEAVAAGAVVRPQPAATGRGLSVPESSTVLTLPPSPVDASRSVVGKDAERGTVNFRSSSGLYIQGSLENRWRAV